MQNNLASMINGLQSSLKSLLELEHSRWWQYPIEPATPIPVNVKYVCDEALGSPSTANCEAALYEFIQSGDVLLDPMSGPIIKVTGESPDLPYNVPSGADLQYPRKLCHSCRSR